MFLPATYETASGIDVSTLKNEWQEKVMNIFSQATLEIPVNTFVQTGGKSGTHTEHLGFILAEMQYLQRSYPGVEW
jgi:ring-1,2-phenylacetyl-CoA epoxidase subunit PaaC